MHYAVGDLELEACFIGNKPMSSYVYEHICKALNIDSVLFYQGKEDFHRKTSETMGTVIIHKEKAYVFWGLNSKEALSLFVKDWDKNSSYDTFHVYPIVGSSGKQKWHTS